MSQLQGCNLYSGFCGEKQRYCTYVKLYFLYNVRFHLKNIDIGRNSDAYLFVDNISPNLQCSMRDMIYPESFNGMTPLHAVAVACTENLPPSGLGHSLTVTNLPSSYTPRILLKLFQGRYPSAYRATIPPATMEGRKVNICLLSSLLFSWACTLLILVLVLLYHLLVALYK